MAVSIAYGLLRDAEPEVKGLVVIDTFYVVWLGLIWLVVVRSSPDQTRRWAMTQDATGSRLRRVLRVLSGTRIFAGGAGVLTIASVCFVGLFSALLLPGLSGPVSALSVVGVVAAWALLHTSFAHYYAYLYYRDETSPGGLDFPGEENPDLLDFAYYAFGIGTTFTSPEVGLASRTMRRTTLAHGILSFFYNTAILALVFNLVIGGA